MAHYDLKTEELKEMAPRLRAGDTVSLTGIVYTARDAAHKKIVAAMDAGEKAAVRSGRCGDLLRRPDPGKAGSGHRLGRPDDLRPHGPVRARLLDAGLSCMIGKGVRNQNVQDAMERNGAVYMVAIGGAGAAKAASIKRSRSSRMMSWAVSRSSA